MARTTGSRVAAFVVYSNWFIALCAAAQTALTYNLLGAAINWKLPTVVFCVTVVTYNGALYSIPRKRMANSNYPRSKWVARHYFSNMGVCVALALLAIALFAGIVTRYLVLAAAIAGLLAALYSLPLLRWRGKYLALRAMPALKLATIGVVWACATVLLPAADVAGHTPVQLRTFILLFLQRASLVAALTVPFDIRDMYQDQLYGVETFAIKYGKEKSLALCRALLAVAAILPFFCNTAAEPPFTMAACISAFAAAALIFWWKRLKTDFYFFTGLDGVLLLEPVIYAALHVFANARPGG